MRPGLGGRRGMSDKRDVTSVILGARSVVMRSEAEDFAYLRHHWGSVYLIIKPSQVDDTWKAIAKFGNGDELNALSVEGLLGLIRRHYGPQTEGYPFTAGRVG
jgi:hypothetical protein